MQVSKPQIFSEYPIKPLDDEFKKEMKAFLAVERSGYTKDDFNEFTCDDNCVDCDHKTCPF